MQKIVVNRRPSAATPGPPNAPQPCPTRHLAARTVVASHPSSVAFRSVAALAPPAGAPLPAALLLGALSMGALAMACGDDVRGPAAADDAGAVRDSGSPTLDAGASLDGGVPVEGLHLRFVNGSAAGAEPPPIEGVHVALDPVAGETTAARLERDSDADGRVDVPLVQEVVNFDITFAKEGFVIASRVVASRDDFTPEDGGDVLTVALNEAAPTADTVDLIITATGLPAGAHFCASWGPWYTRCGAADVTEISGTPLAEAVGERATGYLVDADGDIVEWADAEITNLGRSRRATLSFDGIAEVPPTSKTITIDLPSDPDSPFRHALEDFGPAFVVERGTYLSRGGSSHVARAPDGGSIDVTLTWFPETAAEPLFAFAIYASFDGPVRTFRWFAGALTGDSYAFMDAPRWIVPAAGASLDQFFSFTVPTSSVTAGVEPPFSVTAINNAGRSVWRVITPSGDDVRFPPLPSAYDREISYPFANAGGTVQAMVGTANVPRADDEGPEPYAVDAEIAIGPPLPIVF